MAAALPYLLVTAAYWAFTLTDGALRVLVLLHFHSLGFSPVDIAWLFLLYEVFGIVTNLFGGWLGSRVGLRRTLFAGLIVQIAALLMLSAVRPEWALALSVVYVMLAQALSGIAKDLTKLSAKSSIKLLAGEAQGALFRWVAWLTGSKNALKGLGFFLGGALLAGLGFAGALWAMAGALAAVLLGLALSLRQDLGKSKAPSRFRQLFAKEAAVNWVAVARVFLFAGRDVWFVVAVPIFLFDQLGWSFTQVSGFLGGWIAIYGALQTLAPNVLRLDGADAVARGRAALGWVSALALLPAGLAGLLAAGAPPAAVILAGLALFAGVFAMNSSLHSYLILSYSGSEKIAENVGFYYMANAAGRLAGTLLSGVVYLLSGVTGALAVAALLLAAAAAATVPLTRRAVVAA